MRPLESSFLVPNGTFLVELVLFGAFALLVVWAIYAVIKAAVRGGVDEALRLNRHWMQEQREGVDQSGTPKVP